MNDPLSAATKTLHEPENTEDKETPHVAVDISDMAKWVELYHRANAKIAEAEDLKQQAKDKITEILEAEGADEGKINGKVAVTWYSQRRRNFDTKTFRVKHPELADQFTKVTEFRTFKPKEL